MTTAAGLPLPELSRGRFVFAVPSESLAPTPLGAFEGEIAACTDEALFAAYGVRIAFTERSGGCSVGPFASLNLKDGIGDDAWRARANQLAVCSAFGAGGLPLIVPNQVHGVDIVEVTSALSADVDAALAKARAGADAVVASCADVSVLLCFADCLPLILVAPGGRFAVVHCGWRGAVSHLAALSLRSLCATTGCDPADVNAYIGPHIHASCFEVGEEVRARFASELPDAVVDERHISLADAVACDLKRVGADARRIADVGICTACNTDCFYSFRADLGTTGRHGAFACRFSGKNE